MKKLIEVNILEDDDMLATELSTGNLKIKSPDGFLIGDVTQTDRGYLIELVDKVKLDEYNRYRNSLHEDVEECFNSED